jgi:N6-L-threonylcarbamoyladenine synthase
MPRRKGRRIPQRVFDLVASYQKAIVDTLFTQTRKAVIRLQPRSILLVGGVACNGLLRETFKANFEKLPPGEEYEGKAIPVYYPSPAFTTDNAAMIAAAGFPKLLKSSSLQLDLNAYADLRLC